VKGCPTKIATYRSCVGASTNCANYADAYFRFAFSAGFGTFIDNSTCIDLYNGA
jgi:hypothetical protein